MNVFQNAGIGLGSNFNRRRTRDARDSGGGGGSGGSSTIVAITDKQTKSLLRERDAKIAALEKEVLTLKNKISGLSINNNSMLMVGQRTGKKGLTPYGNTVRVSTSKCSAKRRQVSICGCACFHLLPLNHSLTLHYIQHCIYRLSNSPPHHSSSPNELEWAAMPPSPPKPS